MIQDTGSANPFDGVTTLFDNLGEAIGRGAGVYKKISDLFNGNKSDPAIVANTTPGQPALNTQANLWPYVWAVGGITAGAILLTMLMKR
jgi:hypothetical protein